MNRIWLLVVLIVACAAGPVGCKKRRVKKEYTKEELEQVAEMVGGLREIGDNIKQHSGGSGTGKPSLFGGAPAEPKDQPIDVESAKYLGWRTARNIPKLVELLDHQNPAVRRGALEKLRWVKPPPPSALQPVIARLKDPSTKVRVIAAAMLEQYGEQAKTALPQLLDALKDRNAFVCSNASGAIVATGGLTDAHLPRLIALLSDDECRNKTFVMKLITPYGRKASAAVPVLKKKLSRWVDGKVAAETLARIGAHRELLAALPKASSVERAHIVYGLGFVNPTPEPIVDILVRAAGDRDAALRLQAAESLGRARPTSERIVQTLGRLVRDRISAVQSAAVEALGNGKPQLDSAIPHLVLASKSKEGLVKSAALDALSKFKSSGKTRIQIAINSMGAGWLERNSAEEIIEKDPAAAWKVIKPILDDRKRPHALRLNAARTLSIDELYELDKTAFLRYLDALVRNPREHVDIRMQACVAYASHLFETHPLGAETVVATLEQSRDPVVKTLAAGRLFYLNSKKKHPLADRAITAAIAQLDSPDTKLVAAVCQALGKFGDMAAAAIPVLERLVAGGDREKWKPAARALGNIDQTGKSSVPVLVSALKRALSNKETRRHAGDFLEPMRKIVERVRNASEGEPRYAFDLQSVITLARRSVQDADSFDQGDAAELLGAIGPPAAEAVTDLTALVARNSSWSRDDAIGALGMIGPQAKSALPVLMPMVADPTHEGHVVALWSAAQIGAPIESLLPHLIGGLKNEKTLEVSLQAIGRYGPAAKGAVPALAKALQAGDDPTRVKILKMAAELRGAALPLMPEIRKAIVGRHYLSMIAALHCVESLGAHGKSALPEVKTILLDGTLHSSTRITAGKAWVKIVGDDTEQLKTLVRALDIDEDKFIDVIAGLGPQALKLLPELRKELNGSDFVRRVNAAAAIDRLGPKAAEVIPDLRKIILDVDEHQRLRSFAAMALMGLAGNKPESMTAIVAALDRPADELRKRVDALGKEKSRALFRAALKDKAATVRKQAVIQLSRVLTVPESRQLQFDLLKNDDAALRLQAAISLYETGGYRRLVVPAMIRSLGSVGDRDRYQVRYALHAAGPAAARQLGALVADEQADSLARARAAELLGGMQSAKFEIPALHAALGSKTAVVRQRAAIAVASHDEAGSKATPILLEALKANDADLREAAAYALEDAKADRNRARAALIAALDDADEDVRYAAARSLRGWKLNKDDAPALKDLLGKKHGPATALLLFGFQREVSPAVLPLLMGLLDSDDEDVVASTVSTIGRLPQLGEKTLVDLLTATGKPAGLRALAAATLSDRSELSAASFKRIAPLLEDSQETLKQWAAVLVSRHGPADKARLQLLFAGSSADDWRLSNAAFTRLTQLGPQAAVLLPEVTRQLSDDNVRARMRALKLFGALAKDGKQSAAVLAERLATESNEDRRAAVAREIARLGAAGMEVLKAELNSGKATRITTALRAFESMGTKAKPVEPAIARLLKHSEPTVVFEAAVALAAVNPKRPEPLPILIEAADPERNASQFRRILLALETIGPEKAAAVVPILIPRIERKNPDYRVLRFLAKMKSAGKPARNAVLDVMVRSRSAYQAAKALEAMGPAAADLAPKLLEMLPNERRMQYAAQVLAAMGEAGKPAVAILEKLTWDEYLKIDAVKALGNFRSAAPAVVPILSKLLRESRDEPLSAAVLRSFTQLGEAARSENPTVLAILRDDKSAFRAEAADVLASFKTDPDTTLPALIETIESSGDASLQRACGRAIGAFGPAAKRAVPVLVAMLKSDENRSTAMGALAGIGPGAGAAVPQLTELLTGTSGGTMYSAANTLGAIGPAAKPAVPRLVKLLTAKHGYVRSAAAEALWKIDPAAAKAAKAPPPKSIDNHAGDG